MSSDQHHQWAAAFVAKPQMYGDEPSAPGRYAAKLFADAGARDVLELGAGQGRDTIGLLEAGLSVTALDFAAEALEQLEHAAGPELRKHVSSWSTTCARRCHSAASPWTPCMRTCCSAWLSELGNSSS